MSHHNYQELLVLRCLGCHYHIFLEHFQYRWLLQVRAAASESQQLALLANASALADELLPRAASKLVPGGMQTVMSRDDLRSATRRGRDRDQGKKQLVSAEIYLYVSLILTENTKSFVPAHQ